MKAFLVAIALVALHTTRSLAGDGIVLESYTGAKSEDFGRLLSPVLEELSSKGFVAGSEAVGRKFESRVSRPAVYAEGLPADFADQVEAGHKTWIAGKFDEAVTILGPLVRRAHENTGAFAKNQPLRERLQKALIELALSQQRMGDSAVTKATFSELLRSFPETVLPRASYGPDAAELFDKVRKEITSSGHGRLIVKVTGQSAVYINEKFENVGDTTRDNLLPGEYRVFAQIGKDQLSRSHRAVVKANEDTTVTIDAAFEVAVETTPKLTGFRFATSADREKGEAAFAQAFANAIDARAVAVIGIDQVKGRPAVIGALVNLMTGKEIRRASLAIDPDPSVESLRTLARFLAGEDATSGLDVQIAGDLRAGGTEPGTPERPAGAGPWRGWKFVTGGAAVVALGVGGVLVAKNGSCATPPPMNMQCSDLYNTAVPGWATIGGGVVLTGITVYLFLRHDDPPSKTAYVVPTPGGALAGFATRF